MLCSEWQGFQTEASSIDKSNNSFDVIDFIWLDSWSRLLLLYYGHCSIDIHATLFQLIVVPQLVPDIKPVIYVALDCVEWCVDVPAALLMLR